MKCQPENLSQPVVANEGTYPWEQPAGFPTGGLTRRELAPLIEGAYRQAVNEHAWTVMGGYWKDNQPALKELSHLPPDGCEAMARFIAKHFLRRIPQSGITENKFWEDFCIFNLRACHDYEQGDWFRACLRYRADQPHLLPFLRRVVQTQEAKESPALGERLVFCISWDLFFLPLRFWSDDAAADLLSVCGVPFNLDKVRNLRRELGLKRARPTIVKRFKPLPSTSPGVPEQIEVQLDDQAARLAGLSAIVSAFLDYLKPPKLQSRSHA